MNIIQKYATDNITDFLEEKSKSMTFEKPKYLKWAHSYEVKEKTIVRKKTNYT